jgi:hypothetical protein
MRCSWLLYAERDALLVKPRFLEGLKKRSSSSLRKLAEADVSALYRANYSGLTRKQFPGLFWSDMPPHERIPVVRSRSCPPEWLRVKYDGEMVMKPNPKFELVVVNKYDRAMLLHLLAATGGESMNVERWLAKRTKADGATQADALYADYEAWCIERNEVPTGTKSFSQALVAARVVKLKRGNGGARYALTLRNA